jgi:hypothetical protein
MGDGALRMIQAKFGLEKIFEKVYRWTTDAK